MRKLAEYVVAYRGQDVTEHVTKLLWMLFGVGLVVGAIVSVILVLLVGLL